MTNLVENMVAQMFKDEAIIVEQKAEIERLRKMVKDAYIDGFDEGMREVLESKGGIYWYDSKFKRALEENKFKCPLNDPECKENCGSYGCGN